MSRWLFAVVVNAWVANAADTPRSAPARAPSMPMFLVDWKYSSSAYDPMTVPRGVKLRFEWSSGHDLMMFPDEAAYDSCDFTNAINAQVTTQPTGGYNIVGLAVGTHYFGCSQYDHCVNGHMKIKVTVEPSSGKGGKGKGGKAKKGSKKQKPGKGSKKGGKKPKPDKGYGSKKGKGGKKGGKGKKSKGKGKGKGKGKKSPY